MQPIARDGLAAGQVKTLLEGPIEVRAGLDLLDDDDQLAEDITDDLAPEGSSVERGCYRTIHGRALLRISRELDWGRARVRPYMAVTGHGGTIRANLGIYLVGTPDTVGGTSPATWDVECYDKLEILSHPHGETVSFDASTPVLAAVRSLIEAAGETRISLAASGDDVPLPSRRTWTLSEDTTTLHIINDLLSVVNYRGLWVDWNGVYRSEPYRAPAERGPEWDYDTVSPESIMRDDGTLERDFFDVPNRWVFVVDDPDADELPTEGSGRYTVDNVDDGPTSQQARGRIITAVHFRDAATQAALVDSGDRTVIADTEVVRRLTVDVGPNPLHWHFDVVAIRQPDLGVSGRWLVTDWTLPLDGADMTLDTRGV